VFEVTLPRARALFTTRTGGVSEGPFASRNLGVFTDDDADRVRTNIEQLKRELAHDSMQILRQVHGRQVVEAGESTRGTIPVADGATITEVGAPLLITGADCPTVVIASERRLTALHCGWRSVAAGVIEHAVRDFAGDSFEAAIGPGICRDHFEVGPEVHAAIGGDAEHCADGSRLDLTAVVERRLERAGATRVHAVGRCTYCEPELFFSARRDGAQTGRQAGVAWRV
jgi:YfiH family protein